MRCRGECRSNPGIKELPHKGDHAGREAELLLRGPHLKPPSWGALEPGLALPGGRQDREGPHSISISLLKPVLSLVPGGSRVPAPGPRQEPRPSPLPARPPRWCVPGARTTGRSLECDANRPNRVCLDCYTFLTGETCSLGKRRTETGHPGGEGCCLCSADVWGLSSAGANHGTEGAACCGHTPHLLSAHGHPANIPYPCRNKTELGLSPSGSNFWLQAATLVSCPSPASPSSGSHNPLEHSCSVPIPQPSQEVKRAGAADSHFADGEIEAQGPTAGKRQFGDSILVGRDLRVGWFYPGGPDPEK